jgi:hypothetical protein
LKDPGNHEDKQRDISSLLKSKQLDAYKKSFEGQIKIVEHQKLKQMQVQAVSESEDSEEEEFFEGKEWLKGAPPNVK